MKRSAVKRSSSYQIGMRYTFFVGDGVEPAVYLGKSPAGMHRFLLEGGQEWTGYHAPVGQPWPGQSRYSR